MPNPIGGALTGTFTQSPSSPYATPADAYTAWATALGVSATTSLPVTYSSTDDGMAVIDIVDFMPLIGGTSSKVLLSSEGCMGFYYNPPSNVTQVGPTSITTTAPGQVTVTRFYGTTTPPAIIISGKNPTIDGGVFNFKWNHTTTAFIATARYASYSNLNVDPVDIAIKITTAPYTFEVVVQAPTAGNPRYFQVFYFNQDATAYSAVSDPASVGVLLTQDVTYQFLAITYHVSGTVTDDLGQPAARTVYLYNRTNGALINSTTSDAVTGAFSFMTPTTDPHFVVALDDNLGTQYNDQIASRIIPT